MAEVSSDMGEGGYNGPGGAASLLCRDVDDKDDVGHYYPDYYHYHYYYDR